MKGTPCDATLYDEIAYMKSSMKDCIRRRLNDDG